MKNSLILLMLFGSLLSTAQEIGYFIKIEGGFHATVVPARIEQTGVEFGATTAASVGFTGRLDLSPINTKFGGYSYFYRHDAGWLFKYATSIPVTGHRFFGKIADIEIFIEKSRTSRKIHAYNTNYVDSQFENTLSWSDYKNISRVRVGANYNIDNSRSIEGSLIIESFDENELPSIEWNSTAVGIKVKYEVNNLTFGLESVLNHPAYGYNLIGPPPTMDLPKSGVLAIFSVTKTFSLMDTNYDF